MIICGRRQDRLAELQQQLASVTEVHTLSFDVREYDQVQEAIGSLPVDWSSIDVLINNAGNAHGLASIKDGDISDWDAMLDINVKGLLYVSREVIPGMVSRNSGHIINIGSVAGKEVYPNGNVYCASKYAVDAINQSMRIDLNAYDIRVCAINPGLVKTEFSNVRFKGNDQKAEQVYQGIEPLTGEDIADIIAFVITRPAHVMIADLMVFPTAQASASMVHRKN